MSQSAEAGDEPSVAYYLEVLAAVAMRQGNLERAVRLLAAAGVLLQAKGSGWLHAVVPRAAPDKGFQAALRSRMGDAAFEQAWTRGQSLGGSRAVEYALAEASPEPTRPAGPPRVGDTGAISEAPKPAADERPGAKGGRLGVGMRPI